MKTNSNFMNNSNLLELKNNQDCILFIAPPLLPLSPTQGVATLKAVAQKYGYDVQTIDLNIILWHQLLKMGQTIDEEHTIFFSSELFHSFYSETCSPIVEQWVKQIIDSNPKSVGFSCLSFQSRLIVLEIIKEIRKYSLELKILIGGPGVDSLVDYYSKKNLNLDFITNSAEVKFLQYLGHKDAMLSKEEISSLIPDYSDFDFSLYCTSKKATHSKISDIEFGGNTLYLTASKGCIRNCSFCDVNKTTPAYSLVKDNDTANQVRTFFQKYGITNFMFTDSLVNGTMKTFRKMCEKLSEINKLSENQLSFSGCFICRGPNEMLPSDFTLMREAGIKTCVVGVESGSEKIRKDMNKGFSEEDLWYFVENLNNNNLQLIILLMVGYPTETHEDFLLTLNFVSKLNEKKLLGLDKTIPCIEFSGTTSIIEGTPLDIQSTELKIKYKESFTFWQREVDYVGKNGTHYQELNCPEVREARALILNKLLKKLNILGAKFERPPFFPAPQNIYSPTKISIPPNYLDRDLDKSIKWSEDYFVGELNLNNFLVHNRINRNVTIFTRAQNTICRMIEQNFTIQELIKGTSSSDEVKEFLYYILSNKIAEFNFMNESSHIIPAAFETNVLVGQ